MATLHFSLHLHIFLFHWLICPLDGVDKSVLILDQENGFTIQCIETFVQLQIRQGGLHDDMLSMNTANYSTIKRTVKGLSQKAIQDGKALAIVILLSSMQALSRTSDLLQARLDVNLFYGILQKDNCNNNLQYWDSYAFKNSSYYLRIGGDNSLQSHQNRRVDYFEYHVMAKVKRRSNLALAQIIAAISTKDLKAVQGRADASKRSLGLKLAEYTQTVGSDAFYDLQTLFNFSYIFMTHDDPNQLLLPSAPNTTLNGSKIITKGDINCQYIAQTLARSKQFTLLQPMLHSKYNAFFTKPKLSSLRNAHLQPFQNFVWISIGLTWGLYFALLCAMKYSYQKYYSEHSINGSEQIANLTTLSKVQSGWWVIAFIAGKVPGHPTELLPFLRVSFLTGALTGMIIQIFYSSTILSAITVVISPIKSFDNLVQLNFHFTTHVLSQPMQDILKKVIKDNHLRQGVTTVDNSNQITHLLEQASISTITYSDSFYREAFYQNYTTAFLCERIAAVPLTSYGRAFPISFVARKDSEFTEVFNYGINKIMERGLHRRYFHEYDTFQRNLACRSSSGGGGGNVVWDTVELSETLVPFSCYFVGLGLAMLLIILEKLAKRGLPGVDTLVEGRDL